jgi:hypothetical protein
MSSFPNKRDYIYTVVILVLLNILILSNKLSDNVVLQNKLEFTATITSIILSVIAIVLTLTESAKNQLSSNKINESSDKICNTTNKIDTSTDTLLELVDELKGIDISAELCSVRETLSLVEERNRNIYSKVDTIAMSIKDKKYSLSNDSEKIISIEEKQKFLLIVLEAYEDKLIEDTLIFLHVLYLEKKPFSILLTYLYISSKNSDGNEDEEYEINRVRIFTILQLLVNTGFFYANIANDSVDSISEEFESYVKSSQSYNEVSQLAKELIELIEKNEKKE